MANHGPPVGGFAKFPIESISIADQFGIRTDTGQSALVGQRHNLDSATIDPSPLGEKVAGGRRPDEGDEPCKSAK